MGIYIGAFAVDASTLEQLLPRPLWHILDDIVHTPPGELDILFTVYGEQTKTRYIPSPWKGGVLRTGSNTVMGEDEVRTCAELQQPLGEYLTRGSSYDLKFLLINHPLVDGIVCARQVTWGNRRWWIGSLLAAAARVWGEGPMLSELAGYLARILQGWECGFPLAPYRMAPAVSDFAVSPADDTDNRMAVFSATDCARLVQLLALLAGTKPHFGPPPLGSPWADDTDWNAWVHSMMEQFLRVPALDVRLTHLVTFIG